MRAADIKNPANQRPRDSKVFGLPVSGCRPGMSEMRTSRPRDASQSVLSAEADSQGGGRTVLYCRKSTRRGTGSNQPRRGTGSKSTPAGDRLPNRVTRALVSSRASSLRSSSVAPLTSPPVVGGACAGGPWTRRSGWNWCPSWPVGDSRASRLKLRDRGSYPKCTSTGLAAPHRRDWIQS
jgi:hypothetical protein